MKASYICKNCGKEIEYPIFLTGIEGSFCSDDCAHEFVKLLRV